MEVPICPGVLLGTGECNSYNLGINIIRRAIHVKF